MEQIGKEVSDCVGPQSSMKDSSFYLAKLDVFSGRKWRQIQKMAADSIVCGSTKERIELWLGKEAPDSNRSGTRDVCLLSCGLFFRLEPDRQGSVC